MGTTNTKQYNQNIGNIFVLLNKQYQSAIGLANGEPHDGFLIDKINTKIPYEIVETLINEHIKRIKREHTVISMGAGVSGITNFYPNRTLKVIQRKSLNHKGEILLVVVHCFDDPPHLYARDQFQDFKDKNQVPLSAFGFNKIWLVDTRILEDNSQQGRQIFQLFPF